LHGFQSFYREFSSAGLEGDWADQQSPYQPERHEVPRVPALSPPVVAQVSMLAGFPPSVAKHARKNTLLSLNRQTIKKARVDLKVTGQNFQY
jgi:hypothetical protein